MTRVTMTQSNGLRKFYITDNIMIYMETLSDISVFLFPVQKTKLTQCIVNILMCTDRDSVMLFTLHP